MSKFDEILNSSDASDALLGEQIDKCVKKGEIETGLIETLKGTVDTDNTWCYKSGNVVTFRARATAVTTTSNWENVFKLPYKPIRLTLVYDAQGKDVFNLTDTGYIRRYATISNANIDIFGTYITAD